MQVWNIASLTIHEGIRRNIVRLAIGMGILFLIVFGVGLHYIFVQFEEFEVMSASEMEIPAIALTIVGLYVINFLLILVSVLISVASISSERYDAVKKGWIFLVVFGQSPYTNTVHFLVKKVLETIFCWIR